MSAQIRRMMDRGLSRQVDNHVDIVARAYETALSMTVDGSTSTEMAEELAAQHHDVDGFRLRSALSEAWTMGRTHGDRINRRWSL